MEAGSDGKGGIIRFRSIKDGTVIYDERLESQDIVTGITSSNEGNYIAVSFLSPGEIRCYSFKEKKWIWRSKWPERSTVDNVIRFSADSSKLVVVGYRHIVEYATSNGRVLKHLQDENSFAGDHSSRYRLAVLSPSGKLAAFWKGAPEHHEMFPPLLPKTKWIVVWDIEREKILSDWKQMLVKYENCSAAFTPDEKFLFLGSMDGIMRKWSIEDRKNIDEWKLFSSTISTISFSPEGRLLAIKGSDYLKAGGPGVKIWNLTTNEEIRVFRDVGGVRGACDPYPMAFSNNGTSFVLKHSKTLCLYETSQWKAQWCVDL